MAPGELSVSLIDERIPAAAFVRDHDLVRHASVLTAEARIDQASSAMPSFASFPMKASRIASEIWSKTCPDPWTNGLVGFS